MSFPHGSSRPDEGMESYYENTMQSGWVGVEASPYVGINYPYCTGGSFPAAGILTPISLPDSSFADTRPSPVLSHHSQEYQYGIGDSLPQHGLGITAPFPSDFPRPATAGLGFTTQRGDIEYGTAGGEVTTQFPPLAPRATSRRPRRAPRHTPPVRETPVSILPHPEGLQRLEQERRQSQIDSQQQQRARAPGRRRRDPQAEEEDAFVESLREQNLSWKVIREMFRERFNKDAPEPRLQMRMTRRRKERLARWDEDDIQVLIRARDHLENEKYQIIAQKMKDLGAKQTYTAKECETQLQLLEARHNRERTDVGIGRQEKKDSQRHRTRAALRPAQSLRAGETGRSL